MPFKFGDKKGYYDANEAGGNSRAPAFGSGDGGYYGNTGPHDYDNNMNQNYGGGAPGAFGGNPMGGRNFGNRQYPTDCYGTNRRNSGSSDSDHSDRGEGHRRGSSKHRNKQSVLENLNIRQISCKKILAKQLTVRAQKLFMHNLTLFAFEWSLGKV
ncbi:unnamed protein product [Trichobilharzia szidati]|nr:unnamed protein product [Trichobilharzia szidati]